jgi:hypothetical protein
MLFVNLNLIVFLQDTDAYWRWLVAHHYHPKLKPDFVSWLEESRHVDYSLEVKFYPIIPVAFVRATTHIYWDYIYLWMCALFFILLGLQLDHVLDDVYVLDAGTIALPLVAMLLAQIVPIIGAVVAVVYFNDLAKFLSKVQITRWAVNAVLVAQYIEYAYYGGHSRLDRTSKCRLEHTRSDTMKYSMKGEGDPMRLSCAEKTYNIIQFCLRFGRPARIEDEEDEEEEEEGVSYYLNDEGEMVYIDDDGNEMPLTQDDLDVLMAADVEEAEEASLVGSLEDSQVWIWMVYGWY